MSERLSRILLKHLHHFYLRLSCIRLQAIEPLISMPPSSPRRSIHVRQSDRLSLVQLRLPLRPIRCPGDLPFGFEPVFKLAALLTTPGFVQLVGSLLDAGHQLRVRRFPCCRRPGLRLPVAVTFDRLFLRWRRLFSLASLDDRFPFSAFRPWPVLLSSYVSHALWFSHPCPQHSCDFVPRSRGETWERMVALHPTYVILSTTDLRLSPPSSTRRRFGPEL